MVLYLFCIVDLGRLPLPAIQSCHGQTSKTKTHKGAVAAWTVKATVPSCALNIFIITHCVENGWILHSVLIGFRTANILTSIGVRHTKICNTMLDTPREGIVVVEGCRILL